MKAIIILLELLSRRAYYRTMESTKDEYRARLNRAIDYINRNIEKPLDLDAVAGAAAFSKYHFHRIFGAMVGESLGSYINRLRLEKAAAAVAGPDRRGITEIALDLGFSSPAVFSRAFRNRFGMSPAEWRREGWKEHGKNYKLQGNRYQPISNYRKAAKISSGYGIHTKRQWRIEMKLENTKLEYSVEVRDIPEKTVAYVRHWGPYAGDGELFGRLFGTLMKWAGPRDLFVPGETEMLTIYHDSPEITEEKKLRISVCMTVPEGTKTEGEIGLMTMPEGRHHIAIHVPVKPL